MSAFIFDNHYRYSSKISSWPNGTFLIPQSTEKYDKELDKYSFDKYYLEVYSKNPDSYFISPHEKTLEKAERKAYKIFLNYLNCKNHEFERQDYFRGTGICRKCNLFSFHAFTPLFRCEICNIPTDYCHDDYYKFYCEEHKDLNKSQYFAILQNNILRSKRCYERIAKLNNENNFEQIRYMVERIYFNKR
ncbi:hypothetical protein GCL60_16395 [Silvanigrella paludirubra]|uniref:Uncharacterized protein n=1 Tax=Silvanigrella paludirubra TaxID=2499159 RepID=A0A6N6VMS9_9BACT|nr:hypothetical protein [Silvanigrella paludirubra]KAB8035808.1 hypothetical protein GCL60_16395 [Silvanigrella paludirubra]